MNIEREAREQFVRRTVVTFDRICADLGISAANVHEHDLRQWVTPDGEWHYSIDGLIVLIADPKRHVIGESSRVKRIRAEKALKEGRGDHPPMPTNLTASRSGDIPRQIRLSWDDRPTWRERIRRIAQRLGWKR